MLRVQVASAATGSVQNSECSSGVKALQRCTERLPQLSSHRVFLPTLPRPCVSAHRERRIVPSQEGSERRDFWTLWRQARPIDMRRGPGDGKVLYFPAEEKIAMPLLLAVCRHHIHEGAADSLSER